MISVTFIFAYTYIQWWEKIPSQAAVKKLVKSNPEKMEKFEISRRKNCTKRIKTIIWFWAKTTYVVSISFHREKKEGQLISILIGIRFISGLIRNQNLKSPLFGTHKMHLKSMAGDIYLLHLEDKDISEIRKRITGDKSK